jgi:hypothetical protein
LAFSDKAVPTHHAERKKTEKVENGFVLTESIRNTLLKDVRPVASKGEAREGDMKEEKNDESPRRTEEKQEKPVTMKVTLNLVNDNNNASSAKRKVTLKKPDVVASDEYDDGSDYDYDDEPAKSKKLLKSKKQKL